MEVFSTSREYNSKYAMITNNSVEVEKTQFPILKNYEDSTRTVIHVWRFVRSEKFE